MCFPVNFAKFLRTTFLQNNLWTTASMIRTVECGILAIKKTSVKTFSLFKYAH